jgi:hypothetical protein
VIWSFIISTVIPSADEWTASSSGLCHSFFSVCPEDLPSTNSDRPKARKSVRTSDRPVWKWTAYRFQTDFAKHKRTYSLPSSCRPARRAKYNSVVIKLSPFAQRASQNTQQIFVLPIPAFNRMHHDMSTMMERAIEHTVTNLDTTPASGIM